MCAFGVVVAFIIKFFILLCLLLDLSVTSQSTMALKTSSNLPRAYIPPNSYTPFNHTAFLIRRGQTNNKDNYYIFINNRSNEELETITNNHFMELKTFLYRCTSEKDYTTKPPHLYVPTVGPNDELWVLFKKNLPKGALLGVDEQALLAPKQLYRATYLKNLCITDNNGSLRTAFKQPYKCCDTLEDGWTLLSDLRRNSKTALSIDRRIKKLLYIDLSDKSLTPAKIRAQIAEIKNFITPILRYRPAFEMYYQKALIAAWKDNIMYLEIKSCISSLYELNGTVHSYPKVAEIRQNIVNDFKNEHRQFYGIKVDLVTEEQYRHVLYERSPRIYSPNGLYTYFKEPTTINYENLTNPEALEALSTSGMILEINPMSHIALGLLSSTKMLPPILKTVHSVICSEFPGFWAARPLSDAFYMIYLSDPTFNITTIRLFAENSIMFSSLTVEEKSEVMDMFAEDWRVFLIAMHKVIPFIISSRKNDTEHLLTILDNCSEYESYTLNKPSNNLFYFSE